MAEMPSPRPYRVLRREHAKAARSAWWLRSGLRPGAAFALVVGVIALLLTVLITGRWEVGVLVAVLSIVIAYPVFRFGVYIWKWHAAPAELHDALISQKNEEVAGLRATITRLEAEFEARLRQVTPKLSIDGVEERAISIMEAYARAEPFIFELRLEGKYRAHIREVSKAKVLKVTNRADVAISGIQVQVTDSSLAPALRLPYTLTWFNSGEPTETLGPGVSAFVTLGWKLNLGVSLPAGAQHDWWAGIGLYELPEGATIEIKAWALPDAVADPRTFQYGRLWQGLPYHLQDIEEVTLA